MSCHYAFSSSTYALCLATMPSVLPPMPNVLPLCLQFFHLWLMSCHYAFSSSTYALCLATMPSVLPSMLHVLPLHVCLLACVYLITSKRGQPLSTKDKRLGPKCAIIIRRFHYRYQHSQYFPAFLWCSNLAHLAISHFTYRHNKYKMTQWGEPFHYPSGYLKNEAM